MSTTHVSCGSILGIGIATRSARWRTITKILAAWITTMPPAALPTGEHPIMNILKTPLLSIMLAWTLGLAATGHEQSAPAPTSFDHAHALWSEILAKHVAGDRVDYAALEQDREPLDRYLSQLHAVKPDQLASWTRREQFAFWINAYNAHCVSLVLSEYPIDSIKDIGGLFSPVWKKKFIDMPAFNPSGRPAKLSLDDIEHEILRPTFKDARVHAAVNCASVSCPALRPEAFVAERLDQQLDEQVREWLADPTRNKFDQARSLAELSEIFDWFEEDFVRDGGSVVAWVAKYAPEAEAAWLKEGKVAIEYLDYSWKLNDVKR